MIGTYRELEARWKALRVRGDAAVREVACAGAPRTLLCAELGAHDRPAVTLAAGIHGDEPAGPWALLDLVESAALDPGFSYRIWPCMNPSGYLGGTRESADGVDVNRTFGRGGSSPEARAMLTANRNRTFALSIDLHEDCDAAGFYCYEYGGGGLGPASLARVAERGFPVDPAGCLCPDPVAEAAAIGGLSYSLAMARRAARHVLTFETPQSRAWEERVATHAAAVQAAIAALTNL